MEGEEFECSFNLIRKSQGVSLLCQKPDYILYSMDKDVKTEGFNQD